MFVLEPTLLLVTGILYGFVSKNWTFNLCMNLAKGRIQNQNIGLSRNSSCNQLWSICYYTVNVVNILVNIHTWTMWRCDDDHFKLPVRLFVKILWCKEKSLILYDRMLEKFPLGQKQIIRSSKAIYSLYLFNNSINSYFLYSLYMYA